MATARLPSLARGWDQGAGFLKRHDGGRRESPGERLICDQPAWTLAALRARS